MSDFLENHFIDWYFRAQAFGVAGATAAAGTGPATLYIGLLVAAPSDSAAGTEVTGGSYARVAVTSSLANWAGTQSAGSTSASSGTSGTTSNNNAITFPAPTADQGTVTHFAVYDSATGGAIQFKGAVAVPRTVHSGDAALTFAAGALVIRIDD